MSVGIEPSTFRLVEVLKLHYENMSSGYYSANNINI